VGVLAGVAVAGEVLEAGGDAGVGEAAHGRDPVPGDQSGVRAEAATAHHRVVRVAADVQDGGKVEVDADGGQPGGQVGMDLAGQGGVVRRAQHRRTDRAAAASVVQAGHVAALLVDRDQAAGGQAVHLGDERGRRGVLTGEVRPEQAQRPETLREVVGHPLRQLRALEAPHHHAEGHATVRVVGSAHGTSIVERRRCRQVHVSANITPWTVSPGRGGPVRVR